MAAVHSDLNISGNVSGPSGCHDSGSDFIDLLIFWCVFCGYGGRIAVGEHVLYLPAFSAGVAY